jgi:uncharacterized SAM-binding protein YcdF (DUF218 family)
MFILKKIAAALVLPPAGPVLLAFLGLWLARRWPRTGRAIAALALLALLALSLPVVSIALSRTLEDQPPIPEESLQRAEAIVILGAGTYNAAPEYGGSDTLNRWALERVRYGAYLQKRTRLPILVTGGSPVSGRPEGELMKEVIEREFHGKVQWVERDSRDTAENALYSARLLKSAGIERIALVSHAWHLRRAAGNFEGQGLDVLPAPIGFASGSGHWLTQVLPSAWALASSSRSLTEWLGILVAGG